MLEQSMGDVKVTSAAIRSDRMTRELARLRKDLLPPPPPPTRGNVEDQLDKQLAPRVQPTQKPSSLIASRGLQRRSSLPQPRTLGLHPVAWNVRSPSAPVTNSNAPVETASDDGVDTEGSINFRTLGNSTPTSPSAPAATDIPLLTLSSVQHQRPQAIQRLRRGPCLLPISNKH